MKRTVALALLGVAAAAATSAYGQGYFIFENYNSSPASPIITSPADGSIAVDNTGATAGTQIQIWGAEGAGVPANSLSLIQGLNTWSSFPGYLDPNTTVVNLDTWTAGPWTFQLRAAGTVGSRDVDTLLSRGQTFDVNNIVTSVTPAPPPNTYIGDGFTVVGVIPEPTTFALAGLGAAALLIFRRRD
jgi:hypothetical protein